MNVLTTIIAPSSQPKVSLNTRALFLLLALVLAGWSLHVGAADSSIPAGEAVPLSLGSSRAKLECLGTNTFSVKCTQVEAVAVKQREPTWCWAACAEMLLRYNGAQVTQEQIADHIGKRTKAGEDPKTAGQVEIWCAMNPDLMEEYHRRERAWNKPNTITLNLGLNLSNLNDVNESTSGSSTDTIVQEISSGNPVILGLKGTNWGSGHVVLVYGVEYSRLKTKAESASRRLASIFSNPTPVFAIHKLYIIDPQPDEGQSQLCEVSSDDLKAHRTFNIGKADAREHLMAYMRVFMPTPEEMNKAKAPSAKNPRSRKTHAQNN
jgi:hypothetical protein